MSSREGETSGIRAVLIIEALGRPPEHLQETLGKIIEGIDKEEGVFVRGKKISEPKELADPGSKEESSESVKGFDKNTMTGIEGFYSSFAEVEVEVEEILYLTLLMFKYMPSHIEIITPELIALTNNGWSDILSELTRRLHGYDEIARVMQVERAMLESKLKEVLGEDDIRKIMSGEAGNKPKIKAVKKKSSKKKAGKKVRK